MTVVQKVNVRDAESLVARGDVDVIDVREQNEWMTGHLPSARHVPLGDLRANFGAAKVGPKALFVCAKGGRSLSAAEFAVANGVTEAFSLEGGTEAWAAAGLPIDRPAVNVPTVTEPVTEDAELDAVVGENLRTLRTQRAYTLDTLAGLSGVGRQTLGQIELGRAMPSVSTLWKIARALEVPFSALLARPQRASTEILRQANAKRLVSADGRFSSRALFRADDKGQVEFYELWLAGHGREDADAHAPGTRENLVVTSGRLVLEIGKERFELQKGDAIVFVADVPHAYINPSSDECWMNLVMTYV
jgi:rhodanese-related sulfurtransferase/transcriptional regulator with XRE-family HTH domain